MIYVELIDILQNKDKIDFNDERAIKVHFPHSTVYYVKSLLDAQFSPRKFTYEETKGLLQEVFPDANLS